jgi:hypothetical protein
VSIQLPDKLAWVLNLLGFMWPEADEDKLRACAQAWRDFGAELERIKLDARLVAADVTAENQGDSIDSFERYWQGIGGTGGDFDRAKEAADHMATVLGEPFGMAALVEGMKIAILAQLTLLAGEVGADQLFAVVTLGGSEAVAAGEVIVTRLILRRIIEDVIHRIEREIVEQLKGHVKELLRKILGKALRRAVKAAVVTGGIDLGKQEIDINLFHSRTHLDPGEMAAATGTGFVIGAVVPAGGRRHKHYTKVDPAVIAEYRNSLPPGPPRGHGADRDFQIAQCGPTEYGISGGGTHVWADGIDDNTAHALDAKHVGDANRSPYVPGSKMPDDIRQFVLEGQEKELGRYGKVIADPSNPLEGLTVITNEPAAVPYFQSVLDKFGIPGEVIVR